jgi:hypothetical protein
VHATGGSGCVEVGVIAIPGGARVLIATRPVDFRKGMDGRAVVVKEHLRADPYSGTIFVFRVKRADRLKLILWDGTGLCLQAARGRSIPLAEDRGRCHAADTVAAFGAR